MKINEILGEAAENDALYARMQAQAKTKSTGEEYVVVQKGDEKKFKAIPKKMIDTHTKKGWVRV